MLLLGATSAIAFILYLLLLRFRRRSKQSSLRNLPGPDAASFLTGLPPGVNSPFSLEYREKLLLSYGRAVRCPGLLGDIQLAISDTVALATLLGNRRDLFDIPESQAESHRIVFGAGLTGVRGYEHQRQRKRVQPAFSTRFVRSTTPTLNQVAQELVDVLRGEAQEKAMEVDISDYLGRYSLESIGRATMGCSFGPLNRHGTEYSRAMKRFGPAMVKLHLGRRFLPWLTKTFPPYLLNLASELVPWRALREMKALSNTLHTASKLVLAQRLEDLQRANEDMYDGGGGKDLMTFLLKENATSSDIDTLSDSDLLGQMSLMLLAGTDTTSTTISRVLEMLATHRDVQNELRRELEQATTGAGRSLADMDNDSFAELRFLNAVVKETLRMHPAFYMIPRIADKDIPLPLGTPITGLDGRPIHEVVVPAGTTVLVNILGVNRDPGIWGPDASEWKPARWLSPLPTSVSEAHVPSVFSNTMTFSSGPRACIGYQLAVTKIRIAVAHLVLAFDFTPSDKEIEWKWQGITTPTVRGSPSKKQELPIILTPTKLIS